MVVIVFGLPGSGKSFFASRLAELMKAKYVASDRVRKELLLQGVYSDNVKSMVYNQMLSELRKAVKKNEDIVLDATFYLNSLKDMFINETGENGKIFFIEVIADEALVKERLSHPREDSEADFEVYKKVKQQYEPLYTGHLIVKSGTDNIEKMLSTATQYLQIADGKESGC